MPGHRIHARRIGERSKMQFEDLTEGKENHEVSDTKCDCTVCG